MNQLAVVEPRPPLTAGARPTAIVPTDMDSAYRLAKAVCIAGMAPEGLDTPEKAMIAIMHGLEIGMTPMAALQRIAVVNGRPTIWGDAAMALVRGSGICEWVKERIEGDGDKMVAVCEAKRKGDPEPIIGRFSVSDAKTAGLWGKSGPWQKYPRRMLQVRARAFCLRDGFADVLGGLYLKEELDDRPEREEAASPPRRAPAPAALEHQAAVPAEVAAASDTQPIEAQAAPQSQMRRRAPPPTASQDPPADDATDFESIRKRFLQAAKDAQTPEALGEAWNRIVEPWFDGFLPMDQDDLLYLNRTRSAEIGEE